MCTSLFVKRRDRGGILFGRNMDITRPFGEGVILTPRDYPLPLRCLPPLKDHYAILGTATVVDDYPLYADAMNEKGLCMAGLHFPSNAHYADPEKVPPTSTCLAPFELIPYLLGRCADVAEVREVLKDLVIVDVPFSERLPLTPLHWHIAAPDGGLILEVTAAGLRIYDDLCGVLTNNPPYPYHVAHLHRYDALTADTPPMAHRDHAVAAGDTYDLGLGLVGLPGDFTSPARFARCATLRRLTAWAGLSEEGAVARFFEVLGTVAPPVGCVKTQDGESHATLYTCCMDTGRLTYVVRYEGHMVPLSVTMTEAACRGGALVKCG